MKKKKCPVCTRKKLMTDFALNRTRKDGRQILCRKCKKDWDADYYQQNKTKFLEYNRSHRRKLKEYLDSLKLKCLRCPETHIACLEFHHRDPKKKDISVALALQHGWSLERLKKEVEKCDLLCANCHRKLHYKLVHP
jgi:hypothetical protein